LELILEGVDASHLSARAGTLPALRGVALQIGAGEQLAVIGPSGAGRRRCCIAPPRRCCRSRAVCGWRGPTPGVRRPRCCERCAGVCSWRRRCRPLAAPARRDLGTGRAPAGDERWTSLRSLFYPVDIAAAHDALARFDVDDKLFERVDRLSVW
jgi:phosphonate transport system ATP-binding protein